MLLRFLIWAVLFFLLGRAIRRFFAGVRQGAAPAPPGARRPAGPPATGELMVRDPVCGTFVLPSRSLSARDRTGTHYFCSETCQQAYQQAARPV
jgi:YHS domain-containing protein